MYKKYTRQFIVFSSVALIFLFLLGIVVSAFSTKPNNSSFGNAKFIRNVILLLYIDPVQKALVNVQLANNDITGVGALNAFDVSQDVLAYDQDAVNGIKNTPSPIDSNVKKALVNSLNSQQEYISHAAIFDSQKLYFKKIALLLSSLSGQKAPSLSTKKNSTIVTPTPTVPSGTGPVVVSGTISYGTAKTCDKSSCGSANADVTVIFTNNTGIFTTKTDAYGKYSISLPQGTYSIVFLKAKGKTTKNAYLVVNSVKPVTYNIYFST